MAEVRKILKTLVDRWSSALTGHMCEEHSTLRVWSLDTWKRDKDAVNIRDDILPTYFTHTMAAKSGYATIRNREGIAKNFVRTVMERKLNLLGLIYKVEANGLFENVVFGIMDWPRGWLNREWRDDINGWCNKYIHTLRWKWTVKNSLNTIGQVGWMDEWNDRLIHSSS